MKTFFKSAGITLLVLLALVLLFTGIGWLTGSSGMLSQSFQAVTAPVEKLLDRGVRELETLFSYMHGYDLLLEENRVLKARIADMEAEVRQSQGANEENRRLRTLLKLQESHTDYEFVDAELISWGSGNWSSDFVIDRGSREGVSTGDCVITEEGFVVGLVVETGVNTATVRTVIDAQTAIGAKLQESGLSAVAKGDFSLMSQGQLKLSYVFDGAALCLGDTVLTSGAGGVYPSGLVVGSITDLRMDESGFSEYGVVTPAAELEALTQVFVIRSFGEEDAQ